MEENLYNALLMAAAMLVFVIAITTVFSLIHLTKYTSDAVLYQYDDTKYYEGDEVGDFENITYTVADRNNLYRNVGMETVLPTVYRYVKENYGVTIIDKSGNVIARFDAATESLVHNWSQYEKGILKPDNANKLYDYLNQYLGNVIVYDKNGNENNINIKWCENGGNDFKALTSLWRKIYPQSGGASNISYGASFIGTDKSIAQRLAADFGGSNTSTKTFEGLIQYSGLGGLLEKYKETAMFQEVFKIISDDSGSYVAENGDSVILKSGNSTKLEIIYVIMDD